MPTANGDTANTNTYVGAQATYQKIYLDGTAYYLVETVAPPNYKKYDQAVPVTLSITETRTPVVMDGNNVVVYDLNQQAAVSVGTNDHVSVEVPSESAPAVVPDDQPLTPTQVLPIRINVVNEKAVDLTVVKTDNASPAKQIGGAVFTLTKGSEVQTHLTVKAKVGGAEVAVDATTGRFTIPEGGVVIEGLTAGSYVLAEYAAPAGYNNVIQPIPFSVDAAGAITDAPDALNDGKVAFAQASNTYTVQNEPGAELPMTGGPGTTLVYVLGVALALLAAVLFFARGRAVRLSNTSS